VSYGRGPQTWQGGKEKGKLGEAVKKCTRKPYLFRTRQEKRKITERKKKGRVEQHFMPVNGRGKKEWRERSGGASRGRGLEAQEGWRGRGFFSSIEGSKKEALGE